MGIEKILEDTTKLLAEKESKKDRELDELNLKIQSNIQALKYLYKKNEYPPEIKKQALAIINRLDKLETDSSQEEKTDSPRQRKNNDAVDEELLKGAIELKKMAEKFTASLKEDKAHLKNVAEKMSKNTVENRENFKVLQSVTGGAKLSTYFMIMLLIFIGMYFFIKFF